MTPNDFKELFPALQDIDQPDLEVLLDSMAESEVSAGSTIIPPGKPSSTLYLICDGRVQVSLESEGERRVLGEFGPGRWVGEMGLIEPAPAVAMVTAVDNCRVLHLSHADFMALRRRRPMLTSVLLRVFSSDLAERLRSTLRFIDSEETSPDAGAGRSWFVAFAQNVLGIAARTGT